MQELRLEDFTKHEVIGTFGYYFSKFLPDGREVCLESCLNGFDVAIYDQNKDLIGEKTCTDYPDTRMPSLIEAIRIANKKVKELYAL